MSKSFKRRTNGLTRVVIFRHDNTCEKWLSWDGDENWKEGNWKPALIRLHEVFVKPDWPHKIRAARFYWNRYEPNAKEIATVDQSGQLDILI